MNAARPLDAVVAESSKKYFAGRTRPGPLSQKRCFASFLTHKGPPAYIRAGGLLIRSSALVLIAVLVLVVVLVLIILILVLIVVLVPVLVVVLIVVHGQEPSFPKTVQPYSFRPRRRLYMLSHV